MSSIYTQNENAHPTTYRRNSKTTTTSMAYGTRNAGRAYKSSRGVLKDISNTTGHNASLLAKNGKKPRGLSRHNSNKDTGSSMVSRSRTIGSRRRGSIPVASSTSHLDAKDMDMINMDVEMADDHDAAIAAQIEAIDADDLHDTLTFGEYANDIYAYHRAVEEKMQANSGYMKRQSDINARMREILIDWLIEVHLKFKLEQETLFLTINIIDRFLERRAVKRNKLQLVGCAAMLLASKYEEIYAPEVHDFVYISDQAYTREQILAMETIMLNALDFNLTAPSALKFADRFIKVAGKQADKKFRFQTYYLIEQTLQDFKFVKFLPSMVAASAIFMAGRICGTSASARDNFFSPLLTKYTMYTPEQMKPVLTLMWAQLKNDNPRYKAVRQKYSHTKFLNIARTDIHHAFSPLFE